MKHINHPCPKCRFEHWIRIDRLGSQMRCKECNTSFYLDSTGNCVIGKKPAVVTDPHRYQSKDTHPENDPFAWWDALPKAARFAVGALGILLLLLGGVFWVTRPSAAGVPESLELRSVFVGEAIARDDPSALSRVVADGVNALPRTWIKANRPWEWTAGGEDKVVTRTEVLFQNAKSAMVNMVVFAPGQGSKPMAEFSNLALSWEREGGGPWLLNLDKTQSGK